MPPPRLLPPPIDPNVPPFRPGQIDFIFSSQGLASVACAFAADSEATGSDHRPVVGEIQYPLTLEQEQQQKSRLSSRKHRNKPKPVRWSLVDPLYNCTLLDMLGLDFDDNDVGGELSSVDLDTALH